MHTREPDALAAMQLTRVDSAKAEKMNRFSAEKVLLVCGLQAEKYKIAHATKFDLEMAFNEKVDAVQVPVFI